jgi:hypothetical protein
MDGGAAVPDRGGDPGGFTMAYIAQGHADSFAGISHPSAPYSPGTRIFNTNPSIQGTAGSRYVVIGWFRVTGGTGNVLGTDWMEMRTLTGT